MLQLRPDGTRLVDRQMAVPNNKIHWHHVLPLPDGGTRVLGETYTSTSFGGHFAVGLLTRMLTLGLFSFSQTTLHPRDLVVTTLDSAGQMRQWQPAELPDGNGLMVGGYLPPRRFAAFAEHEGRFRFRLYTSDSQALLLQLPDQILRLDLATLQTQPLLTAPGRTDQQVVATYEGQAAVAEFDHQTDTFTLRLVRER